MNNYSIKIMHIIDAINDTKTVGMLEGFLFKYNNETVIISVHHFKPIISTLINTPEKILLDSKINVYWNELMIFNNPKIKETLNIKIIKSYRTKFIEKTKPINMFINNRINIFIVDHYSIIQNSQCQNNYYLHFLISEDIDNVKPLIQNFKGLSGSPVFDNNNNLIGIFCKVKIEDRRMYGLVLPVIYLIKTLDKKDNENLYYLDVSDSNKIGKYKIKQYLPDTLHKIYYSPISYEIPLDIYYSLEGDINKTIKCKKENNEIKLLEYKKDNNYDISNNIIKKENTFKLNTGLLTYLISNNMYSEYNRIFNEYIKKKICLQNTWISLQVSVD